MPVRIRGDQREGAGWLEFAGSELLAAAGAWTGSATRYGTWEGELVGAFVSWEQHEHDDVLMGKLQLL